MMKFLEILKKWLGFNLGDEPEGYRYEYFHLILRRRNLESLKPLLVKFSAEIVDDEVSIPGSFFESDPKKLLQSALKKCRAPKKSASLPSDQAQMLDVLRSGLVEKVVGKLLQINNIRWTEHQEDHWKLRIGYIEETSIHNHSHAGIILSYFLGYYAIKFEKHSSLPYIYLSYAEAKKLWNILKNFNRTCLNLELIFREVKTLHSYMQKQNSCSIDGDMLWIHGEQARASTLSWINHSPVSIKKR